MFNPAQRHILGHAAYLEAAHGKVKFARGYGRSPRTSQILYPTRSMSATVPPTNLAPVVEVRIARAVKHTNRRLGVPSDTDSCKPVQRCHALLRKPFWGRESQTPGFRQHSPSTLAPGGILGSMGYLTIGYEEVSGPCPVEAMRCMPTGKARQSAGAPSAPKSVSSLLGYSS